MPLSGISHGNPSRIPPWAGDRSAAPAGGGSRPQQEPQMVSLPSCCLSSIPCPTAQPACPNYLTRETAFMHIWCLRGCLLANSCLELAHFDGSISVYLLRHKVVLHSRHIMFINNCLLMSNRHDLFTVNVFCKMEFGRLLSVCERRQLHPVN